MVVIIPKRTLKLMQDSDQKVTYSWFMRWRSLIDIYSMSNKSKPFYVVKISHARAFNGWKHIWCISIIINKFLMMIKLKYSKLKLMENESDSTWGSRIYSEHNFINTWMKKQLIYRYVVESVRRGSTKWLVLLLIPALPFKC